MYLRDCSVTAVEISSDRCSAYISKNLKLFKFHLVFYPYTYRRNSAVKVFLSNGNAFNKQ